MHGTNASVRLAGRLSAAATHAGAPEIEPAWRPWLRLLDVAWTATADPDWACAVPRLAAERPAGAPLLHGTVLPVTAARVRRLVRGLLREAERSTPAGTTTAPSGPPPRARRLDSLGVLRAALEQDADATARLAAAFGVDAGRLGAVAQLATMPILRACADRLREHVPETWLEGYCPVCGAWPALAELRGLERNRRLRCGRCGTDWPIPVLKCPYCSELHHDRLRSFLPEGEEQSRRVDACDTCKGYLKTVSTLQAMPLRSIATTDLATIELDLVAQERGYARPSRPAYPVSITLIRASVRPTPAER